MSYDKERRAERLVSGLIGVIGGFGLIVAIDRGIEPQYEAQVFPRTDKASVMRVQRQGVDAILVEDAKNPGKYIPLRAYLGTIKDEGARNIQEAEIRNAVGWYK